VYTRVPERDEAERSAMLGEPVPFREAAERCDREREREKAERPQPGLDLELFDWVGAEIVGEGAARQPDERQEAEEDERDRREAPAVRPVTFAGNRRRRQKNFLRSIPAYRGDTWSA
jgi:hypothetical protein